ncbi:MAG: hypothetical protein A3G08_01855 [Candidatus Magasanikbacteria bacterium RIFCSPLOWO2_12_FULL_47_9b]|uniref:Uncharacterized protein n=1 Tax=Candidatus Magasanikbacteria bacterium GW2011_GWA2_42_32 TaxID=1619039 RepID=A0A0G1D0W8_9BACT|nr:MAG: hypothetical protein UV20_C0025G0003 [Candidatus Magasanikbacteria bacterium GW2011_GWA2_42_32]OGH80283.1 MAG: hypothetical protein A3C10_03890 [Candidatus Magasanikbacteria bacterium RIFCSPHIGHO2_02_FULL_48_18]OGH82195.1 MAG: hypothetical protein A3G08_01855 [Candidatus Magasanikbacteria bacterium RIFCSPLOWO2_12_FULL_47_9b]
MMKNIFVVIAVCVGSTFFSQSVSALTPLPEIDAYFDFFQKDLSGGAVLETVVIPQVLHDKKIYGISVDYKGQRTGLPEPTGKASAISSEVASPIIDWDGGDWPCTVNSVSVVCSGASPLEVGQALHIALSFEDASAPQYVLVHFLDGQQAEIMNMGVPARAEFTKINPYCVTPPAQKPVTFEKLQINTSVNSVSGGNSVFSFKNVSPYNVALPVAVAVLGAGVAFFSRKKFLVKPVLSGAIILALTAMASMPLYYDIIQKLDAGESIGPWWCPDQCKLGECRNFHITKMLFVQAGEDPLTAGDDIAQMIDMIGYFKWLPNPLVPSSMTDPAQISDWVIRKKINDSNAEAFKEALKKFHENQVLADKMLFGVDLYIYHEREQCGLSDCLGGIAMRYNWKNKAVGPIQIFPPKDNKEARQPYVPGLTGGVPDTWRLGYLIDPGNNDALAKYLTDAVGQASKPKWCDQ